MKFSRTDRRRDIPDRYEQVGCSQSDHTDEESERTIAPVLMAVVQRVHVPAGGDPDVFHSASQQNPGASGARMGMGGLAFHPGCCHLGP